ncbi:28330_t:CDS:1, partial [Gigaspora margarita]
MPQSTSRSLIHSKLLATYQNVSENLKEKLESEVTSSTHPNSFHDKPEFVSSNNSQLSKRVRVEDDVTDCKFHTNNNNFVDSDKEEESTNDNINLQKKSSNSHEKGKEPL